MFYVMYLAGEEERVRVCVVVRDDHSRRLVQGDCVQQREVLAPVHHHLQRSRGGHGHLSEVGRDKEQEAVP